MKAVKGASRYLITGVFVLASMPFIVSVGEGQTSDGIRWNEPLEVAAGGAYRGPWRMNESDFNYIDDPSVVVSQEDTIGVVWVDNAEQDIFFRAFDHEGEPSSDEAVNVSRSPDVFSWTPRIAFLNADTVLVLWQEIVFSGGSHGGEIFFARSEDGGESFSDPLNMSNTQAGAGKGRLTGSIWSNGSLDIITGPADDVYIAWTEYEWSLWFQRSGDGGRTFSDARQIVPRDTDTPARGPSLTASDDGTIYLAWTTGEDSAADIHLVRSKDRGDSFSEPRPVDETGGHSDAPSIAVDHAGILHLVFAENPRGDREQYEIRYTRSDDGGESFGETRLLVSADAHDGVSVHYPQLAMSRDGRLFVKWENFPDHTRLSGEFYQTRRPLGLGITCSEDGGEHFSPPSLVAGTENPALGNNGGQQGLLLRKIAVDAAGHPVVVNSTYRQGDSSHIWLILGEVE